MERDWDFTFNMERSFVTKSCVMCWELAQPKKAAPMLSSAAGASLSSRTPCKTSNQNNSLKWTANTPGPKHGTESQADHPLITFQYPKEFQEDGIPNPSLGMLTMFAVSRSPLHCLWAVNSCAPGMALRTPELCCSLTAPPGHLCSTPWWTGRSPELTAHLAIGEHHNVNSRFKDSFQFCHSLVSF